MKSIWVINISDNAKNKFKRNNEEKSNLPVVRSKNCTYISNLKNKLSFKYINESHKQLKDH
jgi:hypothetical protein